MARPTWIQAQTLKYSMKIIMNISSWNSEKRISHSNTTKRSLIFWQWGIVKNIKILRFTLDLRISTLDLHISSLDLRMSTLDLRRSRPGLPILLRIKRFRIKRSRIKRSRVKRSKTKHKSKDQKTKDQKSKYQRSKVLKSKDQKSKY